MAASVPESLRKAQGSLSQAPGVPPGRRNRRNSPGKMPLPFKGFCTLQRALPCPRLQPVGIRFSFSAGYSALQRGFSTCFSPAFISSFAEAGREARLKPAGTLRGYALSPPAKTGGKKEPPEDGCAQGLHIIHIPVVRVCKPLNGSASRPWALLWNGFGVLSAPGSRNAAGVLRNSLTNLLGVVNTRNKG